MFLYRLNVELDKLETKHEVVKYHHSRVVSHEKKVHRSVKRTNGKNIEQSH
jgi:hypothetical protein